MVVGAVLRPSFTVDGDVVVSFDMVLLFDIALSVAGALDIELPLVIAPVPGLLICCWLSCAVVASSDPAAALVVMFAFIMWLR